MARFARAAAALVAVFWAGSGLWAFLAPRSFFDRLATFAPYNEHLLHDIGALSIGLGAVIGFALARMPALRAALLGVGVGSAFHVAAHLLDYDQKPNPMDIVGLSLVTLLTFAAAFAFDRSGAPPN
ncbi:MAG TPA: hypothetical protein VMY88_09690 [Acidimicrobiales bacterium]|nr:hypothetical protein [Acidimicrobiales bacterium]